MAAAWCVPGGGRTWRGQQGEGRVATGPLRSEGKRRRVDVSAFGFVRVGVACGDRHRGKEKVPGCLLLTGRLKLSLNPHPQNPRVQHPARVAFAENLRPEGLSYKRCNPLLVRV